MKINSKQYAVSLFETVSEADKKEIEKIIKNFAKILIDNNQLSKIDEILVYFNNFWNKKYNIVEAEISYAHELSKEIIKELNNSIKELSGAKEVNIKEKQDKNIIGGLVIRYGSEVLDGSLKTKLNSLKQLIKK